MPLVLDGTPKLYPFVDKGLHLPFERIDEYVVVPVDDMWKPRTFGNDEPHQFAQFSIIDYEIVDQLDIFEAAP